MKSPRSIALLLATASAFGFGCSVGEDPESNEPTSDDLPPLYSEASLSNNARTAFNFFVSKGFTDVQSAGIVGNLMQESSVRPTAVEFGGGPGRGIAQWSVGGRWATSHNDNVTSFAASHGGSKWALTTQLDFMWYELQTFPAYGLSQLRAATTIQSAVTAFQNKYEICGTCAQARRIEYAQAALADYGGGGGTGGGTGGTGGGDPSAEPTETCYSGTLQRDMPADSCVQSMYDDLWYQCNNGEWIDRWSDPDACVAVYPL